MVLCTLLCAVWNSDELRCSRWTWDSRAVIVRDKACMGQGQVVANALVFGLNIT